MALEEVLKAHGRRSCHLNSKDLQVENKLQCRQFILEQIIKELYMYNVVWSVMSIVDLPYRCTQYVRSHCPFSTVCLSVRSVNVYCPSASAITAPRQIPVRLFVLAIEMLLLFYSESGSHCNTGQKWNLFSGQQLNLTIKRKRNLCMMSGTLESWFTLLLS